MTDVLNEEFVKHVEKYRPDLSTARLAAEVRQLRTWISNVATDAQLDAPVPALGGKTGREFFKRSKG